MGKSWKLHHIAVVVRDIDKAVEYYQSLGIASVGREVIFPESKPKIRAKFVQIGSVPIEFIQPVEGESPYKEFLDRKGEGIQHIWCATIIIAGRRQLKLPVLREIEKRCDH